MQSIFLAIGHLFIFKKAFDILDSRSDTKTLVQLKISKGVKCQQEATDTVSYQCIQQVAASLTGWQSTHHKLEC